MWCAPMRIWPPRRICASAWAQNSSLKTNNANAPATTASPIPNWAWACSSNWTSEPPLSALLLEQVPHCIRRQACAPAGHAAPTPSSRTRIKKMRRRATHGAPHRSARHQPQTLRQRGQSADPTGLPRHWSATPDKIPAGYPLDSKDEGLYFFCENGFQF